MKSSTIEIHNISLGSLVIAIIGLLLSLHCHADQNSDMFAQYEKIKAEHKKLIPQNGAVPVEADKIAAFQSRFDAIKADAAAKSIPPKEYLKNKFGIIPTVDSAPELLTDDFLIEVAAVASLYPDDLISHLASKNFGTGSFELKVEPNANATAGIRTDSAGILDCQKTRCRIILSQWFFEMPLSSRIQILAHELAHLIDMNNLSIGAQWIDLFGWKEYYEYVRSPKKIEDGFESILIEDRFLIKYGLVSSYCTQDWSEDFAETVTSYCFQPDFLQKLAPAKYEFLRSKVFFGLSCTY